MAGRESFNLYVHVHVKFLSCLHCKVIIIIILTVEHLADSWLKVDNIVRGSYFSMIAEQYVILSFFCVLSLSLPVRHEPPRTCLKKYFNQSSFVCVCNSTYCDTIVTNLTPSKGQVSVISTSKAGDRFNQSVSGLWSAAVVPEGAVLIKVNTSVVRQTIIGFGGTFTDAAGINIANLPKGAQDQLINSYFAPEGIEYSIGRIPIASNDFSTDIYSYDFTPGDTYLSKFTIAGYDHMYKLPYIDKAVVASRRNISLFASPWSSPDWMKNTDSMVGNGTVASDMKKVSLIV